MTRRKNEKRDRGEGSEGWIERKTYETNFHNLRIFLCHTSDLCKFTKLWPHIQKYFFPRTHTPSLSFQFPTPFQMQNIYRSCKINVPFTWTCVCVCIFCVCVFECACLCVYFVRIVSMCVFVSLYVNVSAGLL